MAQAAYLAIREGIIAGDHTPGSRLRERDLSESLRMSRIPIREALRQLEVEGFVLTYPNRGAVVSQLTLKDVAELFDLRLSLEVLAARQAAVAVAEGRAGDRLREVMAEALRATEAEDALGIQRANTAFHAEVIAMSGNRLLAATMAPMMGGSAGCSPLPPTATRGSSMRSTSPSATRSTPATPTSPAPWRWPTSSTAGPRLWPGWPACCPPSDPL